MGLCSELAQSSRGKKGLWIRPPLSRFLFSPVFFCLVSTEKHAVLNLVTWALWEQDWESHHLTPTTWETRDGVLPAWLNHFWAVVLPVTQKYRPMRLDNKSVLFRNKCCSSLSTFRIWMKSSSTAGLGNELLQDARSNQVPVNSIPSIYSMCHFMNLQYFAYKHLILLLRQDLSM